MSFFWGAFLGSIAGHLVIGAAVVAATYWLIRQDDLSR